MITTESVWYRSSFWSDSSDTVIDFGLGCFFTCEYPISNFDIFVVILLLNCNVIAKKKATIPVAGSDVQSLSSRDYRQVSQ